MRGFLSVPTYEWRPDAEGGGSGLAVIGNLLDPKSAAGEHREIRERLTNCREIAGSAHRREWIDLDQISA